MRHSISLIWLLLPLAVFGQFNLAGDAISLGGDCYRLTTSIGSQEGAAWYSSPISLDQTFKVSFDIFTGTSDGGADGMTFTLQTNNTGVGIGGGSLGVEGISPSVHLEFDTWQNADKGDPWYDHMGIISNGEVSHTLPTALTSYYYVEAGVTNIEDNTYREVIVLWEADIQTMSVWVNCNYRFSYTGDIVNDIFGGDPNVYFGFTGSTGGAVNTHNVCFNYLVFPEDPMPLADAFLCEGDSIQISAAAGFDTYAWSPATGVSDPAIADPWFSPTTATTYTLIMSDACGVSYYDTITIDVEEDDSYFGYPTYSYCAEGSVLPDFIESPGGLFTIEPDGLSINAGTGELTLDGASPGVYAVEYIPPAGLCPVSSIQYITIEAFPDASFAFPASSYCASGIANPTDVITPGGNFSVFPAGLSIDAVTGEVDLATAVIGTNYKVYYEVVEFCSAIDSFSFDIQDFEDASFGYDSTHYCPSDVVSPTFITTAGGSFSVSPAGLSVDGLTGDVDLSSGTIGVLYTITYTTSATDCGASSSVSILIDPLDDPAFAYSATSYCATGTVVPDFITTTGGVFTISGGTMTVDPLTGTLDLETGTVGVTYTVTYTTPDGPCQDAASVSITIDANDDSSFAYLDDTFCPFGTLSPMSIATLGGTFSISPIGLDIDPLTGILDLEASTPGVYTVSYTTPAGLCSSSSSTMITIDTITDAYFTYPKTAYCRVGTAVPYKLHPGGNFSADPGISIDVVSGYINLAACTPGGPYGVYYNSPGCSEQDTFYVTIFPEPVIDFSLAGPMCVESIPQLLAASPVGGTYAGDGVSGNYFYPVLAGGAGLYTITYHYTDANGCVNSATANVDVIEHTVDAGEDVSIIEGSSTELNGTGGVIFSWDPPEGLSCTGCQSPIATPAQTTTYELTGYDANGCVGMDLVTVSLFPFNDITVFVPNTFTPNGDGVNDYLFVYGSDIASIASLQIYDRWGNLVWFGQLLTPGMENQGWDGTINGMGALEGSYAFIAEVYLTFGVTKMVQGNVTLLR